MSPDFGKPNLGCLNCGQSSYGRLPDPRHQPPWCLLLISGELVCLPHALFPLDAEHEHCNWSTHQRPTDCWSNRQSNTQQHDRFAQISRMTDQPIRATCFQRSPRGEDRKTASQRAKTKCGTQLFQTLATACGEAMQRELRPAANWSRSQSAPACRHHALPCLAREIELLQPNAVLPAREWESRSATPQDSWQSSLRPSR